MEEFNKKSNQEILKIKRRALITIFLASMILGPIILFFVFAFLVNLITFSFRDLFINTLFLIPLSVIYEVCYKKCSSYLIYGKDVEIEELKKVEPVVEEKVEGFVLRNERYLLTEAEVLDKILKVDKDFSKTQFYSYTKSLFILIQEAWSNNDYRKLRSFEGDRLFYKHKGKLLDLIKYNQKDVRDKINIKGILLKDFRVEDDKEILIVGLAVSLRRTFEGEEIDYNCPYLLAFSRNVGVKTNPNIELSATNCCNCGAVIDATDDGICNYCNTSLVSGEHEWVLVDLKLLGSKGDL